MIGVGGSTEGACLGATGEDAGGYARYGVPGLATGTLGVLGPMRMSYARTIPTVRYVAGLLSDLVNDTISGE